MQKQIDLAELASVDIQKVSKEELVDASGLCFDPQVPQELRGAYLLNAIGNPYWFPRGRARCQAGVCGQCAVSARYNS